MDRLANRLREISGQLIVVTVVGPYQSGKSSFIQYLTGDETIQIGNGNEELTQGVWLHGPYDLNALKRRWHSPEVDGDQTKVIFFDSEGFGGRVGASEDENRIIMCDLIAPYLAVSQVCVLLHKFNLERGTLESMSYFLEMAGRVCAGVNNGSDDDGNMKIVDVSTCVAVYDDGHGHGSNQPYRPGRDARIFNEACAYTRRIQSERFGDGGNRLLIDKFWPLPAFNQENPITSQSESFQCGFRFVCQDLFRVIDEVKALHVIHGEGTFEAFEMVQERLREEDLEALAARARGLAEFNSAQRIIQPFIEGACNDCRVRIQEQVSALSRRLDVTCRTPEDADLDFHGHIDETMRTIGDLTGVSRSVKRSEQWQTMLANTRNDLCRFADRNKNEYLGALGNRQVAHIISAIDSELSRENAILNERIASQCAKERNIDNIPLQEVNETFQRVIDSELERLETELRPSRDVLTRSRQQSMARMRQLVTEIQNSASDRVHENGRDHANFLLHCIELSAVGLAFCWRAYHRFRRS